MEQQFRSPPDSAKPIVWWHWLDGNVSETGIAADLQWMNRVGIGGVHLLDVGLDTPQWVEKRKPYMSPEWKKAFANSVNLPNQTIWSKFWDLLQDSAIIANK